MDIPDDLIDCQPEFAAALGLTVEEVKALGLRQLSDMAFDRGLHLSVGFSSAKSEHGHLKLRVATSVGLPREP